MPVNREIFNLKEIMQIHLNKLNEILKTIYKNNQVTFDLHLSIVAKDIP